MTVTIGHASIDENGKANSGVAGDQTGKEVVTRQWYNKGWNVLLRPKNAQLAQKSAAACEAACANENIGYDQYGRNTLHTQAKAVNFDLAAIDSPCECDCSSLMHVCAIAGGANLTYGSNGYTTRTMVAAFAASGDYIKLTDDKYLTSDAFLQRGDILVKEGSHTAMVLGSGAQAAPAPSCAVFLPRLQLGSEGDAVKAMQLLLLARGFPAPIIGAFQDRTEAALQEFQRAFNLEADGVCGEATWCALLGLTGVG